MNAAPDNSRQLYERLTREVAQRNNGDVDIIQASLIQTAVQCQKTAVACAVRIRDKCATLSIEDVASYCELQLKAIAQRDEIISKLLPTGA